MPLNMPSIADDGAGFDYKPDDSGRNSFGMGLMEGLTREIRGAFCLDGTNGTTIIVSFEPDPRGLGAENKKYEN